MLLCELFDQPEIHVTDDLRRAMLDILTPMVALHVPFVTVRQVIDELRGMNSGMAIDRALVMQLLDPDMVKAVKKIEGDRIYLQQPLPDARKVAQDQKEQEKKRIGDKAAKQAKAELKKDGAPI